MQEKKNNKKYLIIVILLIIIILILLFFINFGKIQNNLVPTGKVDVFDIDINCNCGSLDGSCTTTDENGDQITIPAFREIDDKQVLGKIFVDDKNGDYVYQQKLEIFNNAAFEYTNKIAPGVSNTYHFVVHNSANFKVKYYLEMYENTEYEVNLKYRLRKNNSYVIGDESTWVNASELKTKFSKINANSSDSYALDWKWMYEDRKDDEDTLAGKNMSSVYKLNIRFYFEAVE